MNQIPLVAGRDPIIALIVVTDADGAAVNADATPIAYIMDEEGGPVTNSDWGVTVASVDPGSWSGGVTSGGVYKVTSDVTTLISTGAHAGTFWGFVTAIVSGVTKTVPITPFRFVPGTDGGKVAADGSNSATSFKVSIASYGAGNLLTTQTDDAAKALIRFISGDLAGQIRKVTAWNSSTGFLTVDAAFTGAPSAGDGFLLVNY